MSLKERIFHVLEQVNMPVAYGRASDEMPYIRYTLVSNRSERLSNKKSIKHIYYQVDLFTQIPKDVETDETLLFIEEELEKEGLITTDWTETIDDFNDTGYLVFHYLMEVRA